MNKKFKSDVQCIACGQWFGGETAFMRHRVGEYTQRGPDYGRRCLSPEEISSLAKGGPLRLNERGTWVGVYGA